MIEHQASAPGKLVVVGEYAVLEGHPALGLAMNRRAFARLTLEHNEPSQLRLQPLSDCPIEWSTAIDPHAGLSAEINEARSMIESSWREWGSGTCPSAFLLEIDTRALLDDLGSKLGLGSSAAVAVLLSGLAQRVGSGSGFGGCEPSQRSMDLRAWHHRLWRLHQGGQGSGLDLATVLVGGLINYTQPRSADATSNAMAKWSSLDWPKQLHGRIVWTGSSASTGDMLVAYRAWKASAPDQFCAFISELGQCAESVIHALTIGDMEAFLEGFTDYGVRMGTMGGLIQRCVVTPAHEALSRLAQAEQVSYKPSGAGGGDVGLMLSTDPDRLMHLAEKIEALGMTSIELKVDTAGWRLE